jgi:hypothetical protein
MKRYHTSYYILFLLLITGGFAGMAQNSYSQLLLGIAATGFFMLFAIQFFLDARLDRDVMYKWESLCLMIQAGLITLEVFYIHISGYSLLFWTSAIALFFVFILRFLYELKTHGWSMESALYGLAVASWFVWSLYQSRGNLFLILGGLLILAFIIFISYHQKKAPSTDGVKVRLVSTPWKDYAWVVLIFFGLVYGYTLGTRLEWLPPMYASEYPQKYYQMGTSELPGTTSTADKNQQFEFKKAYDDFVKKHLD